MFTHRYRQSISCILSSLLLGNTLYAEGIVVDTAAAQRYQATMDTAANGIPLIHIVTPDAGGLSHNKFSEFNINPSGVILNNATSAALTQLGGWVQGNTNLGTTPARVILNEVTGTSRSLLRGYGEIAGHRADVIIANPNGITVNGGGFINTPRAILTTGTPEFSGDILSGFHVRRGDILIEGGGLNASNIDRVDLYTKSLRINAQLYANTLDAVTGENHIATDGTVASDNVVGTEAFSIDSSALGGIYANTIRLIGTDKGVGVNLPQITYASDSLSLSADGHIILGSTYAAHAINLTSAQGDITLNDELAADSLIATSKIFLNTGRVSVTNASIHAQNLYNSGNMYADTMSAQVSQSLINENMISVFSELDISASDLINRSGATLESTRMNFNLSSSALNQGTIHASELSLITPTLMNEANIIADTLSIDGAEVTNNALLKGDISTRITTTGTLTNNGGIIGGNLLALYADTIINNEVLYSANSIDLSAADTLSNTEGSSIISGGTMTIHDTGILRNEAATIQADGDIAIQATAVENLAINIPITASTVSNTSEFIILSFLTGDMRNTLSTIQSIDKSGYTPAYILSRGDISIDAAIHNRYSMIAADGDMYLSGSLNNEAAIEAHTIIDTTHNYLYLTQNDATWHLAYIAHEYSDTLTDHAYSTIQAGGNLYGNLISINNADVLSGTPVSSFSSLGAPASPTIGTITPQAMNYALPTGQYGQFVSVTDPSHPYLIESNPLYTSYTAFIGSDYIMSRLGLDMSAQTKRLGDAMYETQLVRDAVFRLTGERYLGGFGSDMAQYQALMDNALVLKDDLNLELGVKLTASQIAALTHDIVWMEEQVVAGENVLVPTLYLASLKNKSLTPGGKIIAGGDIQLAVSEAITNAGEIKAGGTLLVMADTLINTGGSIKSTGDMLLHATGDITNTSGKISGNNVALISDNGAIISQSALKNLDLGNRIVTSGNLSLIGEQASINSAGAMLLSAQKDIALIGAETSAGEDIALASTSGNVNLTALEQKSRYSSAWGSGSSEIGSMTQHLSTLSAGGDVSINAAKEVTMTSSSIEGKNVALNALGNINITAASDQSLIDLKSNGKNSDLISSTATSEHLNRSTSTSVASRINGESVTLNSGKDIGVQGSNVISKNDTTLIAAKDINILSSLNSASQAYDQQVKKSGFSFDDSAGVMSVGHSTTDTTTNDQAQSTRHVASNIVSLGGNTTLSAGEHLLVSASNLESLNALTLVAKEIDIVAAKNTFDEQHTENTQSHGVSMGITRAPLLAMKSAYEGTKGETPATGSFMNTLSREFEGSNAAAGAASTSTVLSIRTTASDTLKNGSTSGTAASTLTAGGNLNIIATEGSINAVGAQISAEGDALILAQKNIFLKAARSTLKEGATTAAQGFLFDNRSSANTPTDMLGTYNKQSSGNGDGFSLTPTQLSIGGSTTLKTAEGDIAILGSNIASQGDITIDSARNLTIQSSNESGNSANTSDDQAIGKVIISDMERFSGYHTEDHNDQGSGTTQISSNLASLGGDVNLNAGDAYTQSASNVMAAHDVSITAATIDIDTADHTTASRSEDDALKIGAFARVGSPLIDLVTNVEAAQKSDGRLQSMQTMAAAANVYQAAAALPKGGKGSLAFAEVGVGVAANSASSTSIASNAQGSIISAGENLTLTTTEGHIHTKGAALTAGDTLTLNSANNILLEASKNTEYSEGSTNGYGVQVGVGASVGAQTGVYAYVGINASHGSSNSDGTTYDNTHLTADTINLTANRDITLSGADARANTINADAGKNLTIQSLQDHETGKSDESGMNLKVQVSIGTAWEASGGANAAQAKGNYQSVNQQSGLFALDGGYHINVGENTNLIGGAIASSDKAIEGNKNTLTTATLTTTDLENHSDYQAGAIAISGGSDFTKANINGVGVGYESEGQTSLTRSAISEGTITITDEAKQLELTGKTAQETLESINHDTKNAHTAVEQLPDLNALLKEQQAMASATQTVVTTGIQVAQDIKEGKNVLGDAYNTIADKAGNVIAETKNYLYDAKLTPQQRDEIRQTGLKESFVNQLEKSGVSQEKIDAILHNEEIAAVLSLNDNYYKNLVNPKDNTASSSTTQPTEANQQDNQLTQLYIDKITTEESGNKTTNAEVFANILKSGAKSINDLVSIIGEDNAAGAVMVLQIAIEGAPKAILSTIGEGAVDKITEPLINVTSDFIADKGLNAPNASTQSEQEALNYLADKMAEFGLGAIFSGSYTVIRDAKKVVDADGVSTGGKTTADNTIFTGKAEYQAPLNGTGNTYTVYQRDIDMDTPFYNPKTKNTVTNRALMEKGGTPFVQDANGNMVQVNLHHSQQQGSGPLFEITSTTHQASDNQNVLHPYKQSGDGQNPNDPVDRTAFDKDRSAYWKARANSDKGSD